MDSKFAENMRMLRNKKNLSKRAMALEIGITPATYAAYESGDKVPTLETAGRIADAFNVSLDWLCGRKKNDKNGEKPRTWGDIMRLCADIALSISSCDILSSSHIYLLESLNFSDEPMELDPNNCSELNTHKIPDFKLYIKLSPLSHIADGWKKLLSLYRDGNIDLEMYTAWVTKKAAELDSLPLDDCLIGYVQDDVSNEKK